MKKTFAIKVPNVKPERQGDIIRHEIKKYLVRERKKKLTPGVDYWDFACRMGATEPDAQNIHVDDISSKVGIYIAQGLDSFYLEILAKPSQRHRKQGENEIS